MSYEPHLENFSDPAPAYTQREESTSRKPGNHPLAKVKAKMNLGESLSSHDLNMAYQHGDHGFYQQAHAYVHGGGMTKRRKQLGLDAEDKKQEEKKPEELTAEKVNDKKTDRLLDNNSQEKASSTTSKSQQETPTSKNSVLEKPAENKQEAISQLKSSKEKTMASEVSEVESRLPVKAKQEEGKPTVLHPKDDKKEFKSRTGLSTTAKLKKNNKGDIKSLVGNSEQREDKKIEEISKEEGSKKDNKESTILRKADDVENSTIEKVEQKGAEIEAKDNKKTESTISQGEEKADIENTVSVQEQSYDSSQIEEEEVLPTVAPEILEAMKSSIYASANEEKQKVQAKSEAAREAFTQSILEYRESFASEMISIRNELSSHFGQERLQIKTEANKQRNVLEKQYQADKKSLENNTTEKHATLQKLATDRGDNFLKYVEEQKKEPKIIATREGGRVDSELSSASTNAHQVGENVASKYPGKEDSRPEQRQAARDVAKGGKEEIEEQKQPMKDDLLARAEEFDGGFDDYSADTLLQIESVRSQVAPALDELTKSSQVALEAQYKGAMDSLNKQESSAIASLSKQEKLALSQNSQTEQRLMKKFALTQEQTLDAIEELAISTQEEINSKAAQAAENLQGEPGVEESEYQSFTNQSIQEIQTIESEASAKVKEAIDGQKVGLEADKAQTIEQAKQSSVKIQAKATTHTNAVKKGLDQVVKTYITQSKLIVDKLPKDQQSLIDSAFVEVDKAIVDRKGRLKGTNDKFSEELKLENDDNIESAKTPLTDDLNDRATEAAEEAGKSWWEGVLSGILSFVTGLLIVLALALVLVALGLCSTIMGAMMLIGAIFMLITFIGSLYTRIAEYNRPIGASILWALGDAFGVTGIIESIWGKDSITEKEISTFERNKRGTEGVLTLLTIFLMRGGPKKGGGGRVPKGFMSKRYGAFTNRKIGGFLKTNKLASKYPAFGKITSGAYKGVSGGVRFMEGKTVLGASKINEGVKGIWKSIFGKKESVIPTQPNSSTTNNSTVNQSRKKTNKTQSNQAVDNVVELNPNKIVPNKNNGYRFNKKKNNNYDKIEGQPESVKAPEALREAYLAEMIAKLKNVKKVYVGEKADSFLNGKVKGNQKKMSPDLIAEQTNGKYIVGEGKGKNITHAFDQFKYTAEVLGIENISEFHLVIPETVQPGYQVSPGGFLMNENGSGGYVMTRIFGKPIHVTFTK